MTILSVIERDGVLVVDHRLISVELGIQSKNVLANIDKYLATPESEEAFGRVALETETLETNGGIQNTRVAYLNQSQAEFLMTLSRNTPQVIAAKRNLVSAFEKAKQVIKEVIPAQSQEIERLKLELQLVQAKQRYQDSAQGIIASTSLAMLAYLRGDGPPPVQIQYTERFIDPATGREIGSSAGRSLTQLIADAGLNPKSTRDRNQVKKILKCYGFDYDRMQSWSTASYLREYPVLEDEAYTQALKVVLCEVLSEGLKPNLFIHQMQQATLSAGTSKKQLSGVDP